MDLPRLRSFAAALGCACAVSTVAANDGAAAGKTDGFSAMGVRRISPPVPVGSVVLHETDGRPLPLSAFRGKAVLLEFFLPG
ncbi:MAG: hypothetical protein ACJ79H_19655 [Myxococcales bacterium]